MRRGLWPAIVAALLAGCSGSVTLTPIPSLGATATTTASASATVAPSATNPSVALPFSGHTATLLTDGRVLVAGGISTRNSGAPTPSAELYDPATGTWTSTESMHEARTGHSAVLLRSGKVLVVGGMSLNDAPATAELYDPTTGAWTLAGSLKVALVWQTSVLLSDGRVLVSGQGHAEVYDPVPGSWTVTGSMVREGSPAHDARGNSYTATLLGSGSVLVAGGGAFEGCAVASTELFDPSRNTWTAGRSMNVARDGHTATPLRDGRVFVVGGAGGDSCATLASAELYDPTTRTWTTTAGMSVPRTDQAAVRMSDGGLLVLGGTSANGGGPPSLASAEVYHPATGAWTAAKAMTVGRDGATATVLPDGSVLLVGGDMDASSLATAEVYAP